MYISITKQPQDSQIGSIEDCKVLVPCYCPECQQPVLLSVVRNRFLGAVCTGCGKSFQTLQYHESLLKLKTDPLKLKVSQEAIWLPRTL